MAEHSEEHLAGVLGKFSAIGGEFITPIAELKSRLDRCTAVVFDWDGVFNDGRKGGGRSSGFAEADSMGTNMLRFGLWQKLGVLPVTAIISGENNEAALEIAQREHFDAVYTGIRNKQDVIAHLCTDKELQADQVACVIDDINDLSMAKVCGLRLVVRRPASPLFADLIKRHAFCDYVSGASGEQYAVREICELLLGLMDAYDAAIASRVAADDSYQDYFDARQGVTTRCCRLENGNIVERTP